MVIVSSPNFGLAKYKFKVFIDGKEATTVKSGEQIQLDLPLGFHQVHFSRFMVQSKKVPFEVRSKADMISIEGKYNQLTGSIIVTVDARHSSVPDPPAPVQQPIVQQPVMQQPQNIVVSCSGCGSQANVIVGNVAYCEFCGAALNTAKPVASASGMSNAPSAQTSSGSLSYYKAFPNIPDFGAMAGIPLLRIDEGHKIVREKRYIYDDRLVSQEHIANYRTLLKEMEFDCYENSLEELGCYDYDNERLNLYVRIGGMDETEFWINIRDIKGTSHQ